MTTLKLKPPPVKEHSSSTNLLHLGEWLDGGTLAAVWAARRVHDWTD